MLTFKKTDQQRLLEMLTRASIIYRIERRTVIVERGYRGFFTEFTFTAAGSLLDVKAWE